jgi:hypothetical protein
LTCRTTFRHRCTSFGQVTQIGLDTFAGTRTVARVRLLKLAAAAGLAAASLSACSTASPSGHEGHETAAATPAAASSAPAHSVHENAAQPAGVGAVDLRAKLEQYLGQHAILTVRLTRARLRDDGDLAQTADAALTKNTEDMGALIESAYGAQAADQF